MNPKLLFLKRKGGLGEKLPLWILQPEPGRNNGAPRNSAAARCRLFTGKEVVLVPQKTFHSSQRILNVREDGGFDFGGGEGGVVVHVEEADPIRFP